VRFVGLAVLAVLLLGGCGGSGSRHGSRAGSALGAVSTRAITPTGRPLARLSTPGTPKGEQTAPIQVIATPGRDRRLTIALVPVYIDGVGPLPFALDTGASRSLISTALAARLHLPRRGSAGTLYGIAGAAQAENVMVAHWRAGRIRLPAEVIASLGQAQPAGGGGSSPHGAPRGPVGLLGSDVLSRYGKIAIDYDHGLLILDPPVR